LKRSDLDIEALIDTIPFQSMEEATSMTKDAIEKKVLQLAWCRDVLKRHKLVLRRRMRDCSDSEEYDDLKDKWDETKDLINDIREEGWLYSACLKSPT